MRVQLDVTAAGLRRMRRAARRLETVEPRLQAEVVRRIQGAGTPTLQALRRAARAIPAEGPKTRGTRDLMARNTVMSRTGSGLRFQGKPLPGDRRNLPILFEGLRRWRHPVYGNTRVWVGQASSPWFYPTTERVGPEFERACERAIDDTIDYLAG